MFLEFLEDRSPDIVLSPDEALFHVRQKADYAYIVHSGSIELVIGDDTIGTVGADDLIGEIALFESSIRVATAVAGPEGVSLYRLDRSEFLDLMRKKPEFAMQVIKKTTGRLQEMNSKALEYKSAIDSMKDGVIAIDQNGSILALNGAASDMLNIDSPLEFEGKPFSEAFESYRTDNLAFVDAIDDIMAGGEPISNRMVDLTLGGRTINLSLSTSYLVDSTGDSLTGVLAVFRDISELQQLREAEAKLSAELKNRHGELQNAYISIEGNNQELESTIKRVRSMRLVAILLVLLVFSLVGIVSQLERDDNVASVDSSAIEKAQLVTIPVSVKPVSTIGILTGQMTPLKIIPVRSEVSATVARVNFVIGQVVEAGYDLMRLDMSALSEELNKKNSEYVKAVDEMETTKITGSPEDIAKARKNLVRATGELGRIERAIRRNYIKAPARGAVVHADRAEKISEGVEINANEMVLNLVDMDEIIFSAMVDAGNFAKIRSGQKSAINSPAFKGVTLEGRVKALIPVPDDPALYQVLVSVINLDPEQRASYVPHASLTATVEIFDRPDAITVPISSVYSEGGAAKLKIWDSKLGQMRLVSVQTGITTLDSVEILSGLGPDDEVLLQ